MHEDVFDHEHLSEESRAEIAQFIWAQESVELTTVGIDIGSSTSHLLFARILLQRPAQGLSARFVVTSREVLWRSPIMLTPFLPDGTIDAGALGHFIRDSYAAAGLERGDVDSGAVILTGEAIKRTNAQAIDELFAEEAGKFVCATAGHKLECILAAHGSGAVALSRDRAGRVLHVDIGGGTTKLALIENGTILAVSAFAVGGRLLAQDAAGDWTRIDDSTHLAAADLGLVADPASLGKPAARTAIARRLAGIALGHITGAPRDALAGQLQLTDPLPELGELVAVSFSGGVSEYLFGREGGGFGDIAQELANALRVGLAAANVRVVDPGQGIRATVIGASQFTVQVSGKTIFLSRPDCLPVHNVPVVQVALDEASVDPDALAAAIGAGRERLDLAPDARLAIALTWCGDPDYARLAAVGRGIMQAMPAGGPAHGPLILVIDGDVGRSLGHLLTRELGYAGDLVSIDGVALQELDFVDVGELVDPPGVVPVVIKSLVFS